MRHYTVDASHSMYDMIPIEYVDHCTLCERSFSMMNCYMCASLPVGFRKYLDSILGDLYVRVYIQSIY